MRPRSILILALALMPAVSSATWLYKVRIPGVTATPAADPAPRDLTALSLSAYTMPEGKQGVAYFGSGVDLAPGLTNASGTVPASVATWSISSGDLPSGLSLSELGVISGMPTAVTGVAGATFEVSAQYAGDTALQTYNIKVTLPQLAATQITTSTSSPPASCAVTPTGGVTCWGNNASGTRGDGTKITRWTLAEVPGLSGVTALSAGTSHICALTSGGSVYCWGSNYAGQLGTNDATERLTPTLVTGLGSGVTKLAAGHSHTCAIQNGGVKCWGNNDAYALGTGDYGSMVPYPVSPDTVVTDLTTDVADIATGISSTCAVKSGATYCWGNNTLVNTWWSNSHYPVAIPRLPQTMVQVAIAHSGQVCSLSAAGSVYCWGPDNWYGQLGNGAMTETGTINPAVPLGLESGVTSIKAGYYTFCAIKSGAAVCWGRNNVGQVGNGATSGGVATPTVVTGMTSSVTAIDPGSDTTCAIQSGIAKCWGRDRTEPTDLVPFGF